MSEEVSWARYSRPTKDQGNCGSCAWFGTLKVLEMMIKIKANDPDLNVDYSEQHLGACSGSSCEEGSFMDNVLNRLLIGVATEEDCPYLARTIQCGQYLAQDWTKRGVKIGGWKRLTTWDEMKAALRNGPLVGTMAVHQSFMNYGGGVYKSLGPTDPIIGYHCIANDGFSDSVSAIQIINSWGEDWGTAVEGVPGHCFIDRSDSEITAEMYEITLDGPIEPEPGPEPDPCAGCVWQHIPILGTIACWICKHLRK